MIIYYLMMISSCGLIAVSSKFAKRSKFMILLASLIIPAFVAGARDAGVGTDTLVYGEKYFDIVCNYGLKGLLLHTDCEWGYAAFIYIISLFTHEIFWEYFLIEFVIVSLTWISIVDFLEEGYRASAMLIYYLLFFPFSLNIMRQSIAMAIILFSLRFIKKRSFFKFILCMITAALFHKTSIVAVGVYFVYWIFDEQIYSGKCSLKEIFGSIKKHFRWPMVFIVIGLIVLIMINSRDIITFLHFYFNDFHAIYNNMNRGGSALRMTIYYVAMLSTVLLIIPKYSVDYKFFVCVMVLGIIFIQLKNVSTEVYRIALYYLYFAIIGFPKYFAMICQYKWNRFLQNIVLIILLNAYYIDFFMLQGYNQVFPYTSTMLGL